MLIVNRVLVATDFSECADKAVELACEMAQKFAAELHIVHVIKDALPYHGYDIDCPDDIRQQLDALPGPAWESQLTVTRSVRVGPPPSEIVTDAQEREAALIVVGTHGHSGLKSLFLGSVAERVVRAAECPVLTVRHPIPELSDDESEAAAS